MLHQMFISFSSRFHQISINKNAVFVNVKSIFSLTIRWQSDDNLMTIWWKYDEVFSSLVSDMFVVKFYTKFLNSYEEQWVHDGLDVQVWDYNWVKRPYQNRLLVLVPTPWIVWFVRHLGFWCVKKQSHSGPCPSASDHGCWIAIPSCVICPSAFNPGSWIAIPSHVICPSSFDLGSWSAIPSHVICPSSFDPGCWSAIPSHVICPSAFDHGCWIAIPSHVICPSAFDHGCWTAIPNCRFGNHSSFMTLCCHFWPKC